MTVNLANRSGFNHAQAQAVVDLVRDVLQDKGLLYIDAYNKETPLVNGSAYAAPKYEDALPQRTVTSTASVEFIQTVISDGYASSLNWAGNATNNVITFTDGTEMVLYPQGTGGTQVIAVSAVGGPVNGQAFTEKLTVSNCMNKAVLLRDPTQDVGLLMCATGSSMNWQLECWALDKQANVLCHQVIPYNGIFEGLTSNPYFWGGIGTDGYFSLWQPMQYWPAQSLHDRSSTYNVAQLGVVGRYFDGQFTFDKPFHVHMEERFAYNIVFHGLAGNPNLITCIVGRDVLDTEDRDYLNQNNGTTSAYHFDQIGLVWHDRMTKRSGFVRLTPKLGFLNNVAHAYVAYNSGATQITVLENIDGTLRVGQTLAHATGVLGGGTVSGIPAGTTITSWASGTGGPGSVANISAATTAAATSTKISSTDPTPATPQKRVYRAVVCQDGYIALTYLNTRQYSATTGGALTSGNSYRIMKVSGYGQKLYDCEYLSESSGQAYGYHTPFETSDGRLFVLRVANGNSNTTEVHACRVYEYVTGTADSCSSTSGSSTFTVGGNVTGTWDVGMYINHPNYPGGTYITKRGTGTGGAGTYIVSNTATATGAGLSVTSRAQVVVEPPNSANTLNAWWGTYTTYMGVPQTLPARASGFLAMVPQRNEGSKMPSNYVDAFISRKENDNPTNSSPNGNAERLELVRILLPNY